MNGKEVENLIRRLQSNGARDIGRRVARRLAEKISTTLDTAELDFPLLRQDIADSTRLLPAPAGVRKSLHETLNLAWLCTPPGPGSGGHTTLFRMLVEMEKRGHKGSLLLYNRHGSDLNKAAAVIRRHWPLIQADIRPAPETIEGFDGCVASSWETAHVLASRGRGGMHRFYFIQDFEPYFYPRGSLYSLAEDSYRFGFHNIALGKMVASALREQAGVDSTCVAFGCDTAVYSLQNVGPRQGVVFYAREAVDRRGFLLGKLALEEFHRRHPEHAIHVYGDPIARWTVPHIHHGKLSPAELNALYNACVVGMAMSFTNISLVAEEMLACGMTPLVNDHPFARLDLPVSGVLWASATPGGLADALCKAVEQPPTAAQTAALARGVRKGWTPTGAAVAAIIEAHAGGGRVLPTKDNPGRHLQDEAVMKP